ncbi:MAG: hypothetical protein KBA23_00040 [Amaricoccus sp.]|nr:hypothetical protein [Amaricoccus sp.]
MLSRRGAPCNRPASITMVSGSRSSPGTEPGPAATAKSSPSKPQTTT